jgi:septal ring factor EnvC (AmiA/AmiB activator)
MHAHPNAQDALCLPNTPQGCRERLAALQDEIASIRIQIATTDLRRQAARKSLDPAGFHRAKTALRLKQQEAARISAHLAALNRAGAREGFKDTLIEVLRAECDDAHWAALLRRAHTLHETREATHG